MGRRARETLPPAEYLSSSYYEIWLAGLEKLLLETGLVTDDEIAVGRAADPPAPVKRVLRPEEVPSMLAAAPIASARRAPARFAAGDPSHPEHAPDGSHPPAPLCPRASVA